MSGDSRKTCSVILSHITVNALLLPPTLAYIFLGFDQSREDGADIAAWLVAYFRIVGMIAAAAHGMSIAFTGVIPCLIVYKYEQLVLVAAISCGTVHGILVIASFVITARWWQLDINNYPQLIILFYGTIASLALLSLLCAMTVFGIIACCRRATSALRGRAARIAASAYYSSLPTHASFRATAAGAP